MQIARTLVIILALLLCSAATGFAQTAEQVLKQSLKALGGEPAIKRQNTRHWQGRITRQRDGATGTWQLLSLRPNLLLIKADLNGFEQSDCAELPDQNRD
jgi:hypothetical protein